MERVQKLPKASVQQSVQQHDNSSSDEDDRVSDCKKCIEDNFL